MPTKAEFAQQLRRKYPTQTARYQDDTALVDAWIRSHPNDASLIQEGPSFRVTPFALRVIPATLTPSGGFLGAAGAGVGEIAAQIEEYLSEGKAPRMGEIAAASAVGAIPFSGPAKAMTRLRAVAGQAGKGATLGTTSVALQDIIGKGEVPSPGELATGAGIGAVFGGGTQALRKVKPTLPPASTKVPLLENLRSARKVAEASAKPKTTLKSLRQDFQTRFQDVLVKPKEFTEELAAGKVTLTPGESPRDIAEIALGGMPGRVELAKFGLERSMRKMGSQLTDVSDYLDLMGMQEASDKFVTRINNLLAKGPDLTYQAQAQKLSKEKELSDALTIRINTAAAKTQNPKTQEQLKRLRERKEAVDKRITHIEGAESQVQLRRLFAGKVLPVGATPPRLAASAIEFEKQLGPQRFRQVQEHAQAIFDFNRETLDLLHKTGRVSDDLYEAFVDQGGHIPLRRYLDDTVELYQKGAKAKLTLPEFKSFKALKGSERVTKDPFTASMMARQLAEQEASRNTAARAFTDFRDQHPDFEEVIFKAPAYQAIPKGFDTISVWKAGEREDIAFPQEIANALKLLDAPQAEFLGQTILRTFSTMTMRLATAVNVAFAAVNPIRDVMDKIFLSKEIRNPKDLAQFAVHWFSALGQIGRQESQLVQGIATRGRDWMPEITSRVRAFMEEGADYSTLQKQLTIGRESIGPIDRFLAPIERLNNIMERTTKLASFEHLGQKGIVGPERVIRTRRLGGSPDFAVKGAWAPALNTVVLFFNAQVQGITRTVRTVRDMSLGRKIGVFGGLTSAELLRSEWNAQFTDPDGTPSVQRITDNDNRSYWVWLTPELETVNGVERHRGFKIPKGHVAQVLANPIQDVIQYLIHGIGSPTQTALTTLSNLVPGSFNLEAEKLPRSIATGAGASLNPLIKGVAEQLSNRAFFSDVPIVPRRLEGLPAGMQAKPETPEVFKRVGKFLNISPARMQTLSETFLPGSVGESITGLGNIAVSAPEVDLAGAAIRPITRRFVRSPGDQLKRDMERAFYGELDKTREAVQAFNLLKRTGSKAEIDSFWENNSDIIRRSKSLEQVARGLAALRNVPPEQANVNEQKWLRTAMQRLGREVVGRRFSKQQVDLLWEQYKKQGE